MAAFKRRAVAPPQSDTAGDAEAQISINESGLTAQSSGSRAAQYVQHVKALNSQFTSWVQHQLKEHPVELWHEGIQDYLRHASKIKDDFKDVTASLTQTDAHTTTQVSSAEKAVPILSDGASTRGFGTSIFEVKGGNSTSLSFPSLTPFSTGTSANQTFPSLVASPFPKVTSSSQAFPSLMTSQSFPSLAANPFSKAAPGGLPFLNIPAPGSAALPNNGSDTHDTQGDDDEVQEPSSPSVKRSEEPGVKILYEIKCKLFIKGDTTTDGTWKEMGMGNLALRSREGAEKGTKEAKATILVRNEVGRVLLNALLYPNMKMNVQKNTVTGIFHSAEADVKVQGASSQETDSVKGRLYLFRLKTPNDAEQLVEVLTSNAPRAE